MEDLPSRSPGLDFYGLMGTGPKKGRVVSAFLPDVKLEFSEKKNFLRTVTILNWKWK